MRTNSIAITGTIYPGEYQGKELELQIAGTGTSWILFKIATYGGKDRDGTKADKIYHKCLAFGDTAESIAETFSPGDQVIALGYMESDNYTNKEDKRIYQNKVMVNDIGAALMFQKVEVTRIDDRDDSREAYEPQPAPAAKTPAKPDEAPF